jgi:hypothetical protein
VLLRVPLVVRFPGGRWAGASSSARASTQHFRSVSRRAHSALSSVVQRAALEQIEDVLGDLRARAERLG